MTAIYFPAGRCCSGRLPRNKPTLLILLLSCTAGPVAARDGKKKIIIAIKSDPSSRLFREKSRPFFAERKPSYRYGDKPVMRRRVSINFVEQTWRLNNLLTIQENEVNVSYKFYSFWN